MIILAEPKFVNIDALAEAASCPVVPVKMPNGWEPRSLSDVVCTVNEPFDDMAAGVDPDDLPPFDEEDA